MIRQAICVGGIALLVGAAAQAAITVPVVTSGMNAPGTTTTFSSIGTSFSIHNGKIAFSADCTQAWGPGPYNHGLWLHDGQSLQRGVLDLDSAVGSASHIYAPGNVAVNGSGALAGTDINVGLYALRAGTLSRLASGYTDSPGTGGGRFSLLGRPSISDTGGVAFQASTSIPGNANGGTGVWTDAWGNGLQAVAITGQPSSVPGITYGEIDNSVRIIGSQVFHSGTVAYYGLAGQRAFMSHTSFGDRVIARQGDAVPNVAGGIYNGLSFNYAVNDQGHTAFRGSVKVASSSKDAIFVDDGASPRIVAQQGQPAPGFAANVTLSWMNDPAINSSDRVAFSANTSNLSNGLWSNGLDGILRLVAKKGDLAPDVPGGLLFDSFGNMALTDGGYTVFLASLKPSGGSTTTSALFAQDDSGALQTLAYVGESFPTAPGFPAGIISEIEFADSFWNPMGQFYSGNTIVYRLKFQDGRTALYSTIVPEPASLALAALSTLTLLRRRRLD